MDGGRACPRRVGLWVYLRFVWFAGPTVVLPWQRGGGGYELLSPRMLGIALLAPYILWMVGRSLADLPLAQRALSVALRVAFIVLLALGLSRLARTATTQKVCTVFVVDVSDSVPDAALEDARAQLQAALDARPKDDRVRLVTFAKRPHAVPMADDERTAPPVERHGPGLDGATDIASALQLAYGLFPEGYLRRAVILTDGVQTDGDLLAEAQRARSYGVKLFVVPYQRPVPGEVAVRDLRLPDKIHEGETFDVHAQVFSSVPQSVKLVLKQGDVVNGLDGVRQVNLVAGDNDVSFKSKAALPGEVTYALEATEAPQDRFRENNRATAVAAVLGKPVVLYVDGNPARATYLASALAAQQLNVDTNDPLPTSLREAERYDFIVLSDMPAERVSLTQQETIEQYVRDLGGGFLFAGGENGYGLGGWYHTTIERILPVRMDAEKRRDEPEVAMALVIDRSGSMTGLPLEMAKQAARATADTLAGGRSARGHRVRFAADAHRAHDAGQAPRPHPERHRAYPGGRRHGDLSGARRGLPGAVDDARTQEARHSAHRRAGAAERHPRPGAGDGRRGHDRLDRRPGRRCRRELAAGDLRRRRGPFLQGRSTRSRCRACSRARPRW